MATVQEKIELMKEKKAHIELGGGEKRIAKQHEKGKLTARASAFKPRACTKL